MLPLSILVTNGYIFSRRTRQLSDKTHDVTTCNQSAYIYSLLPISSHVYLHLAFTKEKKVKTSLSTSFLILSNIPATIWQGRPGLVPATPLPRSSTKIFSRIRRKKFAPSTVHTYRPLKPPAFSQKGQCSGRLIGKSDQTWFPTSGCVSMLSPLL